jgi:hypothetical protein
LAFTVLLKELLLNATVAHGKMGVFISVCCGFCGNRMKGMWTL